MFGAEKGKAGKLDGKGLCIGIVQARFNESITNALAQACTAELAALGVAESHIEHVHVPGALEIPVALQAMAEKGGYDALVALGCIIRGETYHFELVANESAAGVTRVVAGLPASHRQRDPHHRKPGAGRGPPDRQRPRRGPRRGRDVPTCWTTCDDRRQQAGPAPKPHRAHEHRRPQGLGQVRAQPGPRVRAAGALPAPRGAQRRTVHRRVHPRPGRLPQGRLGALRRPAARLHQGSGGTRRPDPAAAGSQDGRDLAHRAWRDVDRRLRVPALPRRALARGAQRVHRAGQGIRRHRRPQVRERRAQRPGAASLRTRRSRGRQGVRQEPSG